MPQPEPTPDIFPDRYSRQVLFPGIGLLGQRLIAQSTVAVIGVGGIGAASASLLARAGVGRLILIDRDFVEPSNLQRQVLFDEADALASLPKADAARRKILAFNSAIQVEAIVADLVPGNIHTLLGPAQLLLDCSDNFEVRYLLNDYAVQQAKPWIYAGAVGTQVATMTVLPRPWSGQAKAQERDYLPTACLACLFPAPPIGAVETCETSGILPTAVNFAASIQASEAMKLLSGHAHLIRRTLLSLDLWTDERSEITTANVDPDCSVCGPRGSLVHLLGKARPHITLCGRNSVQIHEHNRPLDLTQLQVRLLAHPDVSDIRANALLLRFRRGLQVLTVFPDGRALIQGTTDLAVARSLYARFIGS